MLSRQESLVRIFNQASLGCRARVAGRRRGGGRQCAARGRRAARPAVARRRREHASRAPPPLRAMPSRARPAPPATLAL